MLLWRIMCIIDDSAGDNSDCDEEAGDERGEALCKPRACGHVVSHVARRQSSPDVSRPLNLTLKQHTQHHLPLSLSSSSSSRLANQQQQQRDDVITHSSNASQRYGPPSSAASLLSDEVGLTRRAIRSLKPPPRTVLPCGEQNTVSVYAFCANAQKS